jgi:hypothetical protein
MIVTRDQIPEQRDPTFIDFLRNLRPESKGYFNNIISLYRDTMRHYYYAQLAVMFRGQVKNKLWFLVLIGWKGKYLVDVHRPMSQPWSSGTMSQPWSSGTMSQPIRRDVPKTIRIIRDSSQPKTVSQWNQASVNKQRLVLIDSFGWR